MSRDIYKHLFTFFLLIFYFYTVKATHIVGGVMNYKYLGNDKYEISLYVYRDCIHGIPPLDDPAIIRIWDGVSETYSFPNKPFDDTLPPLPPDACAHITTPVCVNWTCYKDTLILPSNDLGYTIYYQRCCRNNTIQNLTYNSRGNGAMDWGATYTINIPPPDSDGKTYSNTSPVFINYPPVYICVNKPITYDNSAYDADGDSLVYSLCTPYSGAFPDDPLNYYTEETPPFEHVEWKPPYSENNMLGGIPLKINAATGILSGTPNTTGQFVVGICIDEYRKGKLLTHTSRDFQFNIIDCNLQIVSSFFAPTIQCNNFTVNFQNESSGATDYKWYFGDGDSSIDTNPSHTYRDTGRYTVKLVSTNSITNTCKAEYAQVISVQYKKIQADFTINAAPCLEKNDILSFTDKSTDAFNVASWKWYFSNGDSSILQNPKISYNGIDTLISATLTVTSTNGCTSSTIKNFRLYPKAPYTLSHIITKCTNTGNVQISLTMQGNNIFKWTPTTGLNNPNIQNPTTNINTNITYFVTIKTPLANGDTCIQTDSVQVKTINSIQINATDTMRICNDSVRLNVPLSAGQSVIWSTNNAFSTIIGSTASITIKQTTAVQKYYVKITAQECEAIDSIYVLYNDTIPAIAVTKNILQCSNQVNLNAIINYQDSIIWSTSPTYQPILSTQNPFNTIQNTKTVKYYLKATYKTCSNFDSIRVTIQDTLPLISLDDSINICGNDVVILKATIRKATTIIWSDMPDFSTNLGNSNTIAIVATLPRKTYYVRAYFRDCFTTDSIIVNYNNLAPTIQLGDSIFSCTNKIRILANVTNSNKVEWSVNSNFNPIISTNPTLEINQNNTLQKYYIKATSGFCVTTDSILVRKQNNFPKINLKDTLYICADSVRINADISNYDSLQWATTLDFQHIISNALLFNLLQTNEKQTYYVKIFNAGCETIDSLIVFYNETQPNISLSSPANFCSDSVFAYAFAENYTESEWFDNRELTHLIGTTLTLQITQPIGEHWYYFRAKEKFCSAIDSIKLSNNTIKYSKPDINICIGNKATINLNVQTFLPYSIKWIINSDTINTTNTDSITITPSNNQTVYFQLNNSMGCTKIDSLQIYVHPLPTVHATTDKPIAYLGEQIQLTATQNNNYTYNWTPAENLSSANIYNPTTTPAATTVYTVIVTDNHQCKNKDTVNVKIVQIDCSPSVVYIPNAFSPNGDGINDIFKVRAAALKNIHFEIYDRWGVKVYETNDINEGWDGTYKGQQAPVDTYGYYFTADCLQGGKLSLKGNVTLVK